MCKAPFYFRVILKKNRGNLLKKKKRLGPLANQNLKDHPIQMSKDIQFGFC